MPATQSGGAAAPALATTMAPIIPVQQKFPVRVHDLEYQRIEGQSLLARVYQPLGIKAYAAVLDVHGGAWVAGDRATQQGTSQAMASSGVLVVAVDFRQPPGAPYPTSIVDVNLATRWLKVNAGELGAASGARIGAYGGSSGGHVVLLAAMRPHDPRYSALPLQGGEEIDASLDFVVTDAPVTDPQARFEMAVAEGREDLIERHHLYWPDAESPIEGNPTRILERGESVELPPLFVSHGEEDTAVPIAMTRKFVGLYEAAGGHVECLAFPGVGHGFILQEPERPESLRQAEAIRSFIRRMG